MAIFKLLLLVRLENSPAFCCSESIFSILTLFFVTFILRRHSHVFGIDPILHFSAFS